MNSFKKIKSKKNMNKPSGKSTVKKEVNRILQQNMKKDGLNEEYIPFVSRFLKNILEQDEVKNAPVDSKEPEVSTTKSPEEFTTDANQKDFQNSLEPETPADEFDTDGVSPNVTSDTIIPLSTTLNSNTLYRYQNRSGQGWDLITSGLDTIEGNSSQTIFDGETFDLTIQGTDFRL